MNKTSKINNNTRNIFFIPLLFIVEHLLVAHFAFWNFRVFNNAYLYAAKYVNKSNRENHWFSVLGKWNAITDEIMYVTYVISYEFSLLDASSHNKVILALGSGIISISIN